MRRTGDGEDKHRRTNLAEQLGSCSGPGVRWWKWAVSRHYVRTCWMPCGHTATIRLGPVRFLPRAQIFPGPHISHTWTHTHTFMQQHTSTSVTWDLPPGTGTGWPITLNAFCHSQPCSEPRGTSLPIFCSLPETPDALPKHPEVLKAMLLLAREIAAGLGRSVWLEHVMGSESWRLMPSSLQTHFRVQGRFEWT